MERLKDFAALAKYRDQIIAARNTGKPMVSVCGGTGCKGSGADQVVAAFKEELAKAGLADRIEFRETGCHGFCERGTVVVIRPQGVFYQRVQPKDAAEVIEKTVLGGKIIDRLLYVDPTTGEKIAHEHDVPFYKYQQRLIFGSNGTLDPTNIEDYLAAGGYAGLAKALSSMQPDQIIAEVKKDRKSVV